jgi:hypothetical protein
MATEVPKIKGFVEALVNNRVLSGWTYIKGTSGAASDELTIKVYNTKDRQLLGTGACAIHRADLASVKANNTFGFHIKLDGAAALADLALATVEVRAADGSLSHNLTYTAGLTKKIVRSQFQSNMRALSNEPFVKDDSFIAATLKQLVDYDWDANNAIEPSKSETTQVSIPIGQVSLEKIAVSGRQGHFFLYAGSNNLDKLYARRGSLIYKQWFELLQLRQNLAVKHNTQFLQLIIPEKQSLLPALYPLDIQVPTESLELLDKQLAENKVNYVLSCANFYAHLERKENVFKKTDTHFTSAGAKLTVEGLLSALKLDGMIETSTLQEKIISGDLGNKYAGLKFSEAVQLVTSTYPPNLVHQHNPPQGKHIGITRTWKNENAPLKLKVIVFGNSFFERGGNSASLSWWFARLFSEFQFYWSNNCDWDIIEKEQPDIVICQTIERFLTRVPTS